MINIKELRIGNLVEYSKFTAKIYSIRSPYPDKSDRFNNKETVDLFDGAGLIDATLYEINPIPITEEWLIKFGAKKLDKSFPSYNIDGLEFNLIGGKWREYVSQIEITGIHHLQNIFYFRKGYELQLT